VSKNKDLCDQKQSNDKVDDILAYGILAVFKPQLQGYFNSNAKKDYDTRQLNIIPPKEINKNKEEIKHAPVQNDNRYDDDREDRKPFADNFSRFKSVSRVVIPPKVTKRNVSEVSNNKSDNKPKIEDKIITKPKYEYSHPIFHLPFHPPLINSNIKKETIIKSKPVPVPQKRVLFNYHPGTINSNSYMKAQEARRRFLSKLFHRFHPMHPPTHPIHPVNHPVFHPMNRFQHPKILIEEKGHTENKEGALLKEKVANQEDNKEDSEEDGKEEDKEDNDNLIQMKIKQTRGIPENIPILTQLTYKPNSSSIMSAISKLSQPNKLPFDNLSPANPNLRLSALSQNKNLSLMNQFNPLSKTQNPSIDNLTNISQSKDSSFNSIINNFEKKPSGTKLEKSIIIDSLKSQKEILSKFDSKNENNNLYMSNIALKIKKFDRKNK